MTDKEKEAYNEGIEDAWGLAMQVFLDMNSEEFYMNFRIKTLSKNYTYYDVLKILNKSTKFEIGDEVENIETGEHGYVLNPDYRGELVLSMKDYMCPQIFSKSRWRKTGHKNFLMAEILGKDENN